MLSVQRIYNFVRQINGKAKMKKIKNILIQAVLIIAILFGTFSCNSNQTTEDTKEVAEEHNEGKFDNTKDAKFLVNAAEINLEEILLGQLAQQNSTMTDVKELGKIMEKTNRKSLTQLSDLASKKLITIPTAPTDKAKDDYEKLSGKSGIGFDKEYCNKMVKVHKEAISKFEKASTESNDADIREWATTTLPDLRKHLDYAINCQKACEKM
jgi:putative membrane protein